MNSIISTTSSVPRVLIVDDDTDILRLIEMRLLAAGYQVTPATSGEAALTQIATNRPSLVISDLRMPGMDGLALFDVIHKDDPTLPVIILTAHGSIPEAVDATQRGIFGFMTKPFDSKSLLKQIEAALRLNASENSFNNPSEIDDVWHAEIITRSPQMQNLLAQAKLMSASDASVFIQGASGTGKELLARAIHKASPRRDYPFIAINCGAIPESLLESELFGHNKGAFTGAIRDHKGLFQSAHGGTLFLDEIGDMPIPLQVKLLRALQERSIRPIGSNNNIDIDVRIISATHRNIIEEMSSGRFREDLYYRINVLSLAIPSLTKRCEDIPLLANNFLNYFNQKYNKNLNGFAPEAMELMISAPWPGNIRQLQNIVEQIVVLATTSLVSASQVQKALRDDIGSILPLAIAHDNFEHNYLIKLLKTTNGNVIQATRLAQLNRTEFYKLLRHHKVIPALFKEDTP